MSSDDPALWSGPMPSDRPTSHREMRSMNIPIPPKPTLIRRLIKTDGTVTELVGPVALRDVRQMIGAETLDTVMLKHLGQPLHVMLVDDGGHITETIETPGRIEIRSIGHRKPVNAEATRLYHLNCRPGTTHQIVGDVVIVPDDNFGGPL